MIEPVAIATAVAVATNTGALAVLFADFLKQRQGKKEGDLHEEFRTWLKEVAFPHLELQADAIGGRLIAMEAHDHERFAALMAKLNDIVALLTDEDPDPWLELVELDRKILATVFERSSDDYYGRAIEEADMETAFGADKPAWLRALRYLAEKGLVVLHEFAGGRAVSRTTNGMLLAWHGLQPEEARASRERIEAFLMTTDADDCETIESIAEGAQVPGVLVNFVIEELAAQGAIDLQELDAPEHSRVRVPESFKRR